MNKQIKYIYYTGIGANNDNVHTPDEFIKIMEEINIEQYPKYKVKNLNKMNLKKWINYSGAEIIYE